MSLFFADAPEKDTFQIVAGWIGNALALFFFFSPAVGMLKLIKGQIEYKTIPYLALLANIMNCLLWFVFGWNKDDIQVWLCNGIGGVTSIVYITIFWYFFVHLKCTHYAGLVLATFGSIAGIWAIFEFLVTDVEVTGYVAMVFNVLMYAAPGQKLFELFKTGNYNLIPILSSCIGLLCSISWLIYGLYGSTMQIIVPNALGVIFSLIQVGCWLYYYRKAEYSPTLQPFMNQPDDEVQNK